MADIPEQPSGVIGADSERDTRGRFAKGNTQAVITGKRSTAFWLAQDARRREIVAEVIRDAGQVGEPSCALRASADGLAQSIILRDSAFERLLDVGGPLTEAERQRPAFPVWKDCSASVVTHVRLVGLEKKARDVGSMTIQQYQQHIAQQQPVERG